MGSFSLEEREEAIKRTTDKDKMCCICGYTGGIDGVSLGCSVWCCDVHRNETCYMFHTKGTK